MNLTSITDRCNAYIPKSHVVCGLTNMYARRLCKIVQVQQIYHSLMQKPTKTFAVITVTGAAALLLGLALIIFAHYHERAYIFLVSGAGGLIGGIAGMIVEGQKVRVVLDYGLIAMGFANMVIGFNYLIGAYGTEPSPISGFPVIAISVIAILIGMIREMVTQSHNGFTSFLSVIALGVTGSIGIALGIVGSMYLATQNFFGQAFFLLALGAVCLVGGIIGGIFVQRQASNISG